MIIKYFTFIAFALIPFVLHADQEKEVSYDTRQGISTNNRVLASVNGKVISVIDIMKKMDMVLYQHYPQYLESSELRCQFYQMHWRQMLSDIVDRELVIADAQDKNLLVSSGDVREELEEIFGPNMMLNLDAAGLQLSEAWEIIKADITIRRMLYYQVQSRILPQITPQDVRKRYEQHVAMLKESSDCIWKAVSIRASQQEQAVVLGSRAHLLLTEEKLPLDALQEKLQEHQQWDDTVVVSISPLYTQKRGEISSTLQELFAS
ncbi:MAG: SurA N-terminal domain-containing protein, partial [Verrucomicrobia bacterium]|nr:SurA N-terminal domain-containing protein [Verrucomicrobiota bacterium]